MYTGYLENRSTSENDSRLKKKEKSYTNIDSEINHF